MVEIWRVDRIVKMRRMRAKITISTKREIHKGRNKCPYPCTLVMDPPHPRNAKITAWILSSEELNRTYENRGEAMTTCKLMWYIHSELCFWNRCRFLMYVVCSGLWINNENHTKSQGSKTDSTHLSYSERKPWKRRKVQRHKPFLGQPHSLVSTWSYLK